MVAKEPTIQRYSRESYFDHMSPRCGLDLEDSKHFFPRYTLAHDAALPYQIWYIKKCSAVQKISSGQTFTDIFNLRCDLDLERSNPIFAMDTPVYDVLLSNPDCLQTDQQSRRYSRNSHILII